MLHFTNVFLRPSLIYGLAFFLYFGSAVAGNLPSEEVMTQKEKSMLSWDCEALKTEIGQLEDDRDGYKHTAANAQIEVKRGQKKHRATLAERRKLSREIRKAEKSGDKAAANKLKKKLESTISKRKLEGADPDN